MSSSNLYSQENLTTEWYQSRRLKCLLSLSILCFFIFVLLRVGFWLYFYGGDMPGKPGEFAKAFYLGVKFDLRLTLLVLIPVYLSTLLPFIHLAKNSLVRLITRIYLTFVLFGCLIFYIVDFCYFSYLGERLDISILRFFDTPDISVGMVWDSYPVIWISLVIFAVILGLWVVIGKLMILFLDKKAPIIPLRQKIICFLVLLIFLAGGLIGRLDGIRLHSITVLRWGDAYFANNMEVTALALNPILFFFDTLEHQGHGYDELIVTNSYPLIRNYLGLTKIDSCTLNYVRKEAPRAFGGISRNSSPPNIVLVMLESLGANRLGVFGNPLDPTPELDSLIKKSHFFPNFFVPSSGTARTIFGKVTGIPDVSFGGTTASRNPKFANQQTLINTLTEYSKYYFLGGSASWANIRALLQNNIEGLKLYEEGDWKSKNADVWGISDRDLFIESHEILIKRDLKRPFFAVIQTAANHRPFTIPDDDSGFQKKPVSSKEATNAGFLSSDQYNAVRLLDFNIGFYFNELVKNSNYGENTIFLLYGDHNDKSKISPHLIADDQLDVFKHHVPFVIYAPGLLKEGRIIETPMSLVDMMPTAAFLAGVPYINTTLGRNIYDVDEGNSYAIIHGGDRRNRPTIGLRAKDFYLRMLFDGSQASLHDLGLPDVRSDVKDKFPEKTAKMKKLLLGLYHTSRYMMYHNQKLKN